MANFFGTVGNDVANAAIGELTGFTGSVAELTDGIGDLFSGADGDDFVFAANANDTIQGGEGHDTLNGGAGNDVIYGNTELSPDGSMIGDEIVGNIGNDMLHGSNGDDVMEGGEDSDILIGRGGNDLMRGGSGADDLRGGAGADTLDGGDGDDSLFFLPFDVLPGEIINGGKGSDRIIVSVSSIPTVSFTDAASIVSIEVVELDNFATATFTASQVKTSLPADLHLEGGPEPNHTETFDIRMGAETVLDVSGFTFDASWEFSDRVDVIGDAEDEVIAGTVQFDRLFGNGGDDTLIGNGGVDQLFGGPGNDVYLVDQQGGEVDELAGQGDDSVLAFSHYFLTANVENLTLLGTGPVNGTGNSLANTIVGNSGVNFLDGLAGVDTLQGGLGNDVYLVDNAGDVVTEAAGAGTDTVQASVSYTLASGLQVETLMTTIPGGSAAINLTGNELPML